ncbi:MAG: hypothetical protein KAR12_07125, partial [Methylococcales bacterium]|nr:hypothetical protein [Methylococcales bacterium]
MHLKSSLFSLFIFFILSSQLSAQEKNQSWQLVKDENGIKVYTRILANSDYKEFRGEMDVATKLDELLTFIKNAERCPDWQYKCIKMLNLSNGYIYKLSNLPWPLSDRYTVMQSQVHYDQQHNIYTLQLKNIERAQLPKQIVAQLPVENDTVQMRYSDGYWQFKLGNSSTIHITYQMHGDPAGVIPAV